MKPRTTSLLSFLAVAAIMLQSSNAFQPNLFLSTTATTSTTSTTTTTQLSMGKGLNKIKNKQLDLKRKLELAKQQKQEASGEPVEGDSSSKKTLSVEEIKERNDRKRFEELLEKAGANVLNDFTSDAYLNTNQEEEEITAQSKYQ
jgi:hypothetical protein